MQQAEWLAARMADLQALSLTVILDADAEVWRCVMLANGSELGGVVTERSTAKNMSAA
jgi:hypothetical protein